MICQTYQHILFSFFLLIATFESASCILELKSFICSNSLVSFPILHCRDIGLRHSLAYENREAMNVTK